MNPSDPHLPISRPPAPTSTPVQVTRFAILPLRGQSDSHLSELRITFRGSKDGDAAAIVTQVRKHYPVLEVRTRVENGECIGTIDARLTEPFHGRSFTPRLWRLASELAAHNQMSAELLEHVRVDLGIPAGRTRPRHSEYRVSLHDRGAPMGR